MSNSFESKLPRSTEARGAVSRRDLLKGAASVALGSMAGVTGARAQYSGLTPGGGEVPFRLPSGAMNYLDRNEYIHNMEIISHLSGPTVDGGEPLMAMWARGAQRLLPCRSGWVDVSDAKNPQLIETDVRTQGCIAYHEASSKWLMVSSAGQPLSGANPEFPRGRYHEERFRQSVSYSGLRGIRTYDIDDPGTPKLLNEFSTGESGSGTHMNFYDGGRYAYLDAGWSDQFRMENAQRPNGNGLMIVDMLDPENVKEVSRWHVAGQLYGEETEYKKFLFAGDRAAWTASHGGPSVPVRVEDGGTIGYGGFGHFGLYVFDFSDISNPGVFGKVRWDFETIGGIPYHSVYPVIADDAHPQLQNIVIGVPEAIEPDCREPYKPVQVIDASDPRNPRIIGLFPRPTPPEDAPYTDFCFSRGRFGTHNIQCWVAPGSARPEIVVMTFFTAGIRVYDISDPTSPREVAWYLPPRGGEIEDYGSWFRGEAETVFIEWDRNLIWFGTHEGSYCLSTPALGAPSVEPQRIESWTVPHGNRGWDT